MSTTEEIFKKIIDRFKEQEYCQVPGYNRFGFIRDTGSDIIISREKGNDTRIPYAKIKQGIQIVKNDPSKYNSGPTSLREDITFINSPVWSLLHLVDVSDYQSIS